MVCLYTRSISRFARNTVTLLETVRELQLLGVDVYFEEQNIHSLSGDGELMLTILASYAQAESLSASENCKWCIRKRFENGELANLRFMFGYQIVKGKVDINPEQAVIVSMIFNDYINGMGGGEIADKLKKIKVATVLGRDWDGECEMTILTNEKYKGDALLQKKFTVDFLTKKRKANEGEVPQYYVQNSHPAIIEPDEFDSVQAEIERCKGLGRPSGCGSPFSAKIVCGDCGGFYGSKVWGSNTKYRRVIWRCNEKYKNGKKCKTLHVTEDDVK